MSNDARMLQEGTEVMSNWMAGCKPTKYSIEEWKAARFAAVDGGAPSGKLTAKRETQGRP